MARTCRSPRPGRSRRRQRHRRTRARPYRHGQAYLLTARTNRGQHHFSPQSPKVPQAFWYCLGLAQKPTGVRLTSACCMSDHVHLTVEDVEARVDAFRRRFHSLFARAVNSLHGSFGNVFEKRDASMVELCDPAAHLEAAVYTELNPTQAGLVRHPSGYPNAVSTASLRRRRVLKIRRPDIPLFRGSSLPEQVEVVFDAPLAFAEAPHAWHDALDARVDSGAVAIARSRAARGLRFLGARGCRRVSWRSFASPLDFLASSSRPKVKASTPALALRALEALRAFQDAYTCARDAFASGARDVVFPYGTLQLARRCGVEVAPST